MNLLEEFQNSYYWQKVIDKGVDKQMSINTLQRFCHPLERQALFDEINSGCYAFKPPKICKIPKENGGVREIYVNNERDRIVFAVINQIWSECYGDYISPACKSYQEGLSCAKAVREASAHLTSGYKIDLSKYFDSVPREVLNKALKELSTNTMLDDIIWQYYNTDEVIFEGKKVNRYKSLAQGCALSAFLSNYILRDIDSEMLDICDYYCRYSDDMLLLGPNADKALKILEDKLHSIGLSLNYNKVEEIDAITEFRFLGFGLRARNITISQHDFDKKKYDIKHLLKHISRQKLSSEKKLKLAVQAVMNTVISFRYPTHSWVYTKSLAVNDLTRIRELDNFCKEHIRATVTGKWNYTSNIHKVPEEALRDAGYVSLVHMFKIAQLDRTLFEQECLLWKQHMI